MTEDNRVNDQITVENTYGKNDLHVENATQKKSASPTLAAFMNKNGKKPKAAARPLYISFVSSPSAQSIESFL